MLSDAVLYGVRTFLDPDSRDRDRPTSLTHSHHTPFISPKSTFFPVGRFPLQVWEWPEREVIIERGCLTWQEYFNTFDIIRPND